MVFEKCEFQSCNNEPEGISRCKDHDKCDGCGKHRDYFKESEIHLIHRIEGLWCDNCWTERMKDRVNNFEGNTEYTDEITCPYCGHIVMDSWEHASEENTEIGCNDCGNNFEVSVHHSVDFSTYKKDVSEVVGE